MRFFFANGKLITRNCEYAHWLHL